MAERQTELICPGVSLAQEEGLPKLGADSLALAEFATVKRGWRVCDLGCGAGVLSVLLFARQRELTFTGLELLPRAAELAAENFACNGMTGRVLQGDLRRVRELLPAGGTDLVISNPPYFSLGTGKKGRGDRSLIRSEAGCTLEEVCQAGGWLLKNGGRMALVCPTQRLCDLLCAMREAGIEPKRLRLAAHSPDAQPSLVLAEGIRQGGVGLTVLPTLFLSQRGKTTEAADGKE